jgi:signal transduction histidine kinase
MIRRHWSAALTILAIVVFGSYLLYTEMLVREIQEETKIQTRIYTLVQRGLLAPPGEEGAELMALAEIQRAFSELNVPIIVINAQGQPNAVLHLPFQADLTTPAGRKRVLEQAARLAMENKPIVAQGIGEVYFGSPPIARWLRWVPWLQAGGALILLAVALAILRANARADRERMWAAMARELAHQMGTPLSSLSGWVEVLSLPEGERSQLATGDRLAEAIAGDVERLERVSRRFELIGRPPTLQSVSPAQVIQDLERYLRPRLPRLGAGVDLRVRVHAGLPLLWGNAVLLAWALENLVKNALDALAGRGGSIVVTARRAGPTAVRILVADDGPGIAPEVRDRIFEPGVSTKRAGWGVGLSLTRRIVEELHGGRITARTRRTGGTVFEMRLPTAEARQHRRRWLSRR